MGSTKVSNRLTFILLFVVCGTAVLLTVYLIIKPQRDAAHLIQTLEQLQVGRTRIEDIAPALRNAGAAAGLKGGNCDADLNGSLRPEVLHSTESKGASPLPAELQRVCSYSLSVDNKFLHRLRLAPVTNVAVAIDATDGTVDQIIVLYATGEFGNIGIVHFIQSIAGKTTTCGQDTCVGRFYGSDGKVIRLNVQAASGAPAAERNRLLNFNTHCLSKIGGCKNASELLPIGD